MSSSGSPTPLPTSSASSFAGRRARRTEKSDSSSSLLGAFDIANTKLRVVTPPRPLPLVSYPDGNGCAFIRRLFGNEFESKAFQAASESGIPDVTATLTARVFRDDALDTQPAILIVADEWAADSPGPWQSVVEKVKRYIDRRVNDTLEADGIDISVEMVAADLVREKYLARLDEDETSPRLKEAWPRIKDGIFTILESFSSTAGHITAIALFKLGFDRFDNNPKTVYVSVGYESAEVGWPPVLDKMQAFVNNFEFDLHVHIEHNLVGHCAFPLVLQHLSKAEIEERRLDYNFVLTEPYSTSVNAGADIGAGRYLSRTDGKLSSSLVGTLGCWLDVNIKDKGWKTVALTNYHVVRPALEGFTVGLNNKSQTAIGEPSRDSDLWKADIRGLLPTGVADRYKMEHPTRAKHNFTVDMVGRQFLPQGPFSGAGPARDRRQAVLDQQITFFDDDKQYFGEVWFASGYMQRTCTNGRLDWALVLPIAADRIGSNVLPSEMDWQAKNDPWNWPEQNIFGMTLEPQALSIHNMRDGDRVFKNGASTTCTTGSFNVIKPDCTIAEERYMPGRSTANRKSTEFMFISVDSRPFANRGDSGSVVWDREGRVMGLLFRGQKPQQNQCGYSLVTPIEDVFESIKKLSNGHIVDVRIARA